ncbi:unnamed protein product [Lampetra planeri]
MNLWLGEYGEARNPWAGVTKRRAEKPGATSPGAGRHEQRSREPGAGIQDPESGVQRRELRASGAPSAKCRSAASTPGRLSSPSSRQVKVRSEPRGDGEGEAGREMTGERETRKGGGHRERQGDETEKESHGAVGGGNREGEAEMIRGGGRQGEGREERPVPFILVAGPSPLSSASFVSPVRD